MGIFDRLFRRRRQSESVQSQDALLYTTAATQGEPRDEDRGEGGKEEVGPAEQDIQVDESSATEVGDSGGGDFGGGDSGGGDSGGGNGGGGGE